MIKTPKNTLQIPAVGASVTLESTEVAMKRRRWKSEGGVAQCFSDSLAVHGIRRMDVV